MAWLKRIWKRLVNGTVAEPSIEERARPQEISPPEAEDTRASTAPSPSEAEAPASPVEAPVANVPEPEEVSSSGAFRVGWITDVGQVRSHNEDGLFVFTSEQEGAELLPAFGLFVLADGMGGHQAGEIASSTASRTVVMHLLSEVYLSLLRGEERISTQPSLTEVVAEAITAANRAVNLRLPGSGTTLTCGMVLGSRLFIGHVGDSRAYLRSRTGEVRRLTNDHSMVNKLVEIGQLTPEEAASHPQRNMLYRAVGQGAALDVDVISLSLQLRDQLFLCSDGLWGILSEEEMWRLIDTSSTPAQACKRLAEAANTAGGNDNISVILIEIQRRLI